MESSFKPVGIIIVILAIIGLIWALSLRSDNDISVSSEEDLAFLPSEEVSLNTDNGSKNKSKENPDVTPDIALERCVNSERESVRAEDISYEKGTILASFHNNISLGQAVKIVESSGLGYEQRENLETDFENNKWLTVIVTEGEEFKGVCLLRRIDGVKNVILNRLFELHELKQNYYKTEDLMETKEQAVSSVGERIKKSVAEALSRLKIEGVTFVLEHPDSLIHGDYFTNAAMAAAKKIHKSPLDLAEKIVAEMRDNCPEEIEKIEIAGAGFINFSLSSKFFADSIDNILSHSDSFGRGDSLSGQKIMVEYTDPNIFKPFHIGHLMSNAIGESISRIIQFQGADIIRACYPSDVGLHIAKAVWGYLKNEKNAPLLNDSLGKKVEFLGDAYVSGSEAYEKSEQSKKEIDSLNEKIFEKGDEKINSIYDNGKKWSTEHFEEIYECLGTKFDVFIYESEVAEKGKRITNELVEKSVFEKSEGAIIFNGEKFGLHKRVFVTSRGLPTYEAKELGLNLKKFEMFPDITSSMIITGNEQNDYFKVLIKALSLINESALMSTLK